MPGGSARFGGALNPGNLRTLMMNPQGGVRSPQDFGAAILGAFGGAPPMQHDPRIMAQSGYGPPTGNFRGAAGPLNAYQAAMGPSTWNYPGAGYDPGTGGLSDLQAAADNTYAAGLQAAPPRTYQPRGSIAADLAAYYGRRRGGY